MSFRHLTSPRLVTAALLAVVAVVLMWWVMWSFAATHYRNLVDGWIAQGRANGYTITFDKESTFGFPRRVVLRFTNMNWTNTDKITFHADDMDLTSRMGQWNRFEAKFKDHVALLAPLDTDQEALSLAGRRGVAQVELDDAGVWKTCQVQLENAELGKTPSHLFKVENLSATATRPDAPPKDHTETGLTLTGAAENVTIPPNMLQVFGDKIQTMAASIRVMGDVPDFRQKDSVARWNNDSGIVEFDSLSLNWGVLKMDAKGTLGFDDDLQPEGAFASVIQNHDAVLKVLADHGYIAERKAAMLNSALSLFAKPTDSDDENKGLQLPITVQLGGFFLGPVQVFAFPQIEWATSVP